MNNEEICVCIYIYVNEKKCVGCVCVCMTSLIHLVITQQETYFVFCAMLGTMKIFTKGFSCYSQGTQVIREEINMNTAKLNTDQHKISAKMQKQSAVGPKERTVDQVCILEMNINTNFIVQPLVKILEDELGKTQQPCFEN